MTAVYQDADGYTHTNRYAQDNILTEALSRPPQERASLYPQYIVSESHHNVLLFVLKFWINKNRKYCISSTCD